MKKSFYALELFVQPGGVRESLVFVFNNLDDIKRALSKCLSHYMDVYLMTWYGREVNLLVYEEGKEVQQINLLPYIRIQIEGYPEIRYAKNGSMKDIKFSDKSYEKGYAENDGIEVDGNKFIKEIEYIKFTITVDWDSIVVHPLSGELVKKRDKVTIYSNYIKGKERVGYGFNETENALHKTNIDWDDEGFGVNNEDVIDFEDEGWDVDDDED